MPTTVVAYVGKIFLFAECIKLGTGKKIGSQRGTGVSRHNGGVSKSILSLNRIESAMMIREKLQEGAPQLCAPRKTPAIRTPRKFYFHFLSD